MDLLEQEIVSGSGILGHMQICTLTQTHNHITPASTTLLFTGQMPFLPLNQQRQSTEGTLPLLANAYNLLLIYRI